ncbi:MAG: SDR family oxidoreductase [Firmicutes bacterium]|nr:SDR family oxidoreductase [Bacillota bacterium]MBR4795515.1 SDR family oxidoreductase [Lachnospiraceae bacterium]
MKKSVFITGGSRGIGAACVKRFAEAGWNVAFTYKEQEDAASQLLKDAEALGDGLAVSIRVDLTPSASKDVYEGVAAAIKNAKTYFGIKAFDTVICNAGIGISNLITDMSAEEVEELIGINLTGSILTAKAALPDMLGEKSGNIIIMSSILGRRAGSCEAVYSASKAGLIGFGRSLAAEVGPSGIRVNVIAPGVIDTDMCANFDEETRKILRGETPLDRFGVAEDIAGMALFLSGDDASFITGQVIGIDGGFKI